MQRHDDEAARPALVDETGAWAPSPLFSAFLGALGLSGALAVHSGADASALADFLLLASLVAGSTLVLFAGLMIWAARAGQRVAELAALRPGAVVLRGARVRGLGAAMRRLHPDVAFLPVGITLLADETGFELWSGSPEHPIRLGREPWERVDVIRVSRVTRWGRAVGGVTLEVRTCAGDSVELPLGVLGAGLGGLAVPSGLELETIVARLRDRRDESVRV
ncbi:hypothetical protein [Protaetiibacter mangrovi]|uniref:PH domain-containing protein n=1 Tax=Protaetiibacter mangrovi TaxID=2970926 RepID=A0ABT1ZDD1_9MICO|nr:hypothetical protein [Protaetiibacter mangrovi]MCS0498711.1 hypothetical protein [Protaetiibacter mangrovi]TPX02647.1 hypothetical protein FJ656_21290 [Schumannella luteola]